MFHNEQFRRTVGTHLQGEGYGWLGGSFLIDEVGTLLDQRGSWETNQ